jgi:ketosteroid isomerase-like protein
MSQENVEIVRRSYEAYERGDLTGMLTAADPDLITHRAAPQPDAGTWHGREGFLQAFASWIEDFDAFALTVEELIDANDTQVITRLHQCAVGSESGVPIEADFWFLHTLSGQRIRRLDIYAREEQALEAAGLQK